MTKDKDSGMIPVIYFQKSKQSKNSVLCKSGSVATTEFNWT